MGPDAVVVSLLGGRRMVGLLSGIARGGGRSWRAPTPTASFRPSGCSGHMAGRSLTGGKDRPGLNEQ
jgi:hypothetical protein